jgi:hypothetical protein
VTQLAGRPALANATAEEAVEVLIMPPERLRALMIAEAELEPSPIPIAQRLRHRSRSERFRSHWQRCSDGRHLLETTRRGVFAIGDVRARSIKRVAAAVGEGAYVVAALHVFLTAVSPTLADGPTFPIQPHPN